jgi:hypothetical protein
MKPLTQPPPDFLAKMRSLLAADEYDAFVAAYAQTAGRRAAGQHAEDRAS